MGVFLWLAAGTVALLLARAVPLLRGSLQRDALGAVAASVTFGAVATSLDFGGWNELDWRAGIFVLFGALSAIAIVRCAKVTPV